MDPTRRDFLKLGAATGAGLALQAVSPSVIEALAAPPPRCGKLTDIKHVVILIQENRSFDHYFGTLRGVDGFGAQTPVFQQPDPANGSDPPVGYLLPFHITGAPCTADITHDWGPQHRSWNGGAMDRFAIEHLAQDPDNGQLTMGYYDSRIDAPFFHAAALAFTVCDRYFCSVIGPTDPNRLYTMSAWLDPAGQAGGPLLETLTSNRPAYYGRFTWTTMPEQLQARRVGWKVYSPPDSNAFNNVLMYFKRYQDPSSPLYRNAFLPSFPGQFQADCTAGTLPAVSWVLAPLAESEHPPAPPRFGEDVLHQVMNAVTGNPDLWKHTAIFATYDENGGFFDHAPPPTAPTGTAGEYVSASPLPASADGIAGPIGLGFRVPMLVISPLARGGFVSSDVFDHTSVLRFLEARWGVEVPNLTAWRRNVTGDLTSAFNFAHPDTSLPALPATLPDQDTLVDCTTSGYPAGRAYPVPNPQSMPSQEAGMAPRPSGPCA